MKICIPTSVDLGVRSEVSAHFADAPFFILADLESAELETVQNPECHKHPGACHHVRLLEAHRVDAVVCEGIGRRAASGLREAGIDVLVPPARGVAQIIAAVDAGRARSLSVEDGCGEGTGHRHRRRHRRGGHIHPNVKPVAEHGSHRDSRRPPCRKSS